MVWPFWVVKLDFQVPVALAALSSAAGADASQTTTTPRATSWSVTSRCMVMKNPPRAMTVGAATARPPPARTGPWQYTGNDGQTLGRTPAVGVGTGHASPSPFAAAGTF